MKTITPTTITENTETPQLCNRTGCNEIGTVYFMRQWGALCVCEGHAAEERRNGEIMQAQQLSDQEKTIVSLIGRGYTQPQIARKLTLSHATIKSHLQRIFRKTGTRNQTQVALYALRTNLVSMHEINFGNEDLHPEMYRLNTWRRWHDISESIVAKDAQC